MEVDTEAAVESLPPGLLQPQLAVQPPVVAQPPAVALQPAVTVQPPATVGQPPVTAQPPAAAQPPVAVNQVLTPAVEALLAQLALQLPQTEAVVAEVERDLTQFVANVANSATSTAAPVTPAAVPVTPASALVTPIPAFDEVQSRLAARIYGLDPVRNTQADLVALIREHQLPVSPACGGRASRTKRIIIDELRRHVGQEPLPVPMGTPVRPLVSPPRARPETDARAPPQAAPLQARVRPLVSPPRQRPAVPPDLPSSRLRSHVREAPGERAEATVADVADDATDDAAPMLDAQTAEAAPCRHA